MIIENRLEQAEIVIQQIAHFFGTTNTHQGWCNYIHPSAIHCNCGVADAREYMKKHLPEKWKESCDKIGGVMKGLEDGSIVKVQ